MGFASCFWGVGLCSCWGLGGGCLVTAMPTAPALARRAKPLRVSSLRASIGIALALSGCAPPADAPIGYYDLPTDPQVENYVFSQCLTQAKGPDRTVYNDWDEAIDACGRWAANAARYCPAKAKCNTDALTRADVRAILPAQPKEINP